MASGATLVLFKGQPWHCTGRKIPPDIRFFASDIRKDQLACLWKRSLSNDDLQFFLFARSADRMRLLIPIRKSDAWCNKIPFPAASRIWNQSKMCFQTCNKTVYTHDNQLLFLNWWWCNRRQFVCNSPSPSRIFFSRLGFLRFGTVKFAAEEHSALCRLVRGSATPFLNFFVTVCCICRNWVSCDQMIDISRRILFFESLAYLSKRCLCFGSKVEI